MTEVGGGMEVVSSQIWDGETNEWLLRIGFFNNFGAASGLQACLCNGSGGTNPSWWRSWIEIIEIERKKIGFPFAVGSCLYNVNIYYEDSAQGKKMTIAVAVSLVGVWIFHLWR